MQSPSAIKLSVTGRLCGLSVADNTVCMSRRLSAAGELCSLSVADNSVCLTRRFILTWDYISDTTCRFCRKHAWRINWCISHYHVRFRFCITIHITVLQDIVVCLSEQEDCHGLLKTRVFFYSMSFTVVYIYSFSVPLITTTRNCLRKNVRDFALRKYMYTQIVVGVSSSYTQWTLWAHPHAQHSQKEWGTP